MILSDPSFHAYVMDCTAFLPSELIAAIFNYLTRDDLRVVISACSRWRDIIRDMPVYWMSIVLASIVPDGLDALTSLIGATRGRPFELCISLRAIHPPISVSMLNIIGAHVCHMTALNVVAGGIDLTALDYILCGPCPLLRSINLEVPDANLTLPHRINASSLQWICLHIQALMVPSPTHLPTVETLIMHGKLRETSFNLIDVFQFFPNIRHLFMDEIDLLTFKDSWKRLESLGALETGPICDWEDWVADIPYIAISVVDLSTRKILEHLGIEDPLELFVDCVDKYDQEGAFGWHFKSLVTQISRSVYVNGSNVDQLWDEAVIEITLQLLLRVATLSVSPTFGNKRTIYETVPNLQQLRIIIEPCKIPLLPLVAFPLYKYLDTIILHCYTPGGVVLDADDIDLFTISALRHYKTRFPLQLKLENVIVERSGMDLWLGRTFYIVDERPSSPAWRRVLTSTDFVHR